jgi:PAS domain S-box-containing protein
LPRSHASPAGSGRIPVVLPGEASDDSAMTTAARPSPPASLQSARLQQQSGAMREAVEVLEWAGTPIGLTSAWPRPLRVAVDICLDSSFPMLVLWGRELVTIYNDAYIGILRDKHPWALGQPVSRVWPEIWPTIGPMLQGVLHDGVATRHDDLLLLLQRRGFVEECYFTFSYSPLRLDDGSVAGVFVTVLETTARVVSERRLRLLGDLATRLTGARDKAQAIAALQDVLSKRPPSFPFGALYLLDAASQTAVLSMRAGSEASARSLPPRLALHDGATAADAHPVLTVLRSGHAQVFPASAVIGAPARGAEPDAPTSVVVLPIRLPGRVQPQGAFVAGANPWRPLDDEYRSFFGLVAGHVGAALASAEATEDELRRVDALSALDRARSRFFSDVSHELRTPVTLILGPLEDMLRSAGDALPAPLHQPLEGVLRSARRLRRLVDSMLDFSRIEGGGVVPRAEPTDIAALTREVASLFRSAIEGAGLQLSVRTEPAQLPVEVDREMWERILLNLLSNAFKYTQAGAIEVSLAQQDQTLVLGVRDTGCGIASEDLPHVFERFYRSPRTRGRSIEGAGIGLAVVHELARLLGGHVAVASELERGSRFEVAIPLRPADREPAAPPDRRAAWQPFVDELGHRARTGSPPAPVGGARASSDPDGPVKVLVADDNQDLTDYIARVLRDRCEVLVVHDGARALEAAVRDRPDLLLADVTMPGLDGFALLRAIRADARIRTLSVILLSARAGEEARLEALDAGADDYFVKPFSARELIARVHSQVRLVKLRRTAVERERELLQRISTVEHDLEEVLAATNDAFARLDDGLRIVAVNEAAARLLGAPRSALRGRLAAEVCPPRVVRTLGPVVLRARDTQRDATVEHFDRASDRWFSVRCYRTPTGLLVLGADVTAQRRAQQALRRARDELERRVEQRTHALAEANALLAAVFDRAPSAIAITDTAQRFLRANAAYQRLLGRSEAELQRLTVRDVTEPADYARKDRLMQRLLHGDGESFALDLRYRRADGGTVWVSNFVSAIADGEQPRYFVKIAQDISQRKHAEDELLASQAELRALYDRLQSVREDERLALAREVHDQLGQVLSAAKIDIKLLEDAVAARSTPPPRRRLLTELRSAVRTIDEGIAGVRRIATELRPPELDDQGLQAAIRWHAADFQRRTRLRCSVDVEPGFRDPQGAVATALFRIYQEAMTNVLRHAQAAQVSVQLLRRGGAVLLRVCDDGVGIERGAVHSARSIGLKGMRERALVIQGRVTLRRLRPRGTLVSARVPLETLAHSGFSPLDAPMAHDIRR